MVGLVEVELGRVFRCHQNKEQTAVAAGHTHSGPLDAFNQTPKKRPGSPGSHPFRRLCFLSCCEGVVLKWYLSDVGMFSSLYVI